MAEGGAGHTRTPRWRVLFDHRQDPLVAWYTDQPDAILTPDEQEAIGLMVMHESLVRGDWYDYYMEPFAPFTDVNGRSVARKFVRQIEGYNHFLPPLPPHFYPASQEAVANEQWMRYLHGPIEWGDAPEP
ncbi:hypothetical protein [Crucivirus-458]|nr:hypothetical protein [Crucivirus-458]